MNDVHFEQFCNNINMENIAISLILSAYSLLTYWLISLSFQVFGSTGDHSRDYWTPPSCITTTAAPTSPAPNTPTTTVDAGAFGKAMDTNEDLKEEISGLKQQYGPIGIKVWEAMKDSFFHSFEGYRAREQVGTGQTGKPGQ